MIFLDASDGICIVVLVILIYFSAYFSSAETALTSVSRLRLRSLSDDGDKRASLALDLIENKQTKMLTAILIANNIVNLSASAIASVVANKLGGNFAVTIGTAVITMLIIIFGEVTPKTMATVKAEKVALRDVRFVNALMIILTPLVFFTGKISRGILKIRHINPDDRSDQPTEEDIRTMVEVSHEDGQIENDEKQMINNVFDLTDSEARDIMVPRVDVVCTDVNMSFDDLIAQFSEQRFTRVPVYQDNPDSIIGILNMKDVLLYDHKKEFNIRDYIREAFFTHEFKNTYELFLEMRKASQTMSIVLDEYGVMVGIITMEDILEEIVGEIRDEYDQEELDEIRKIGPNDYIVDATCRIDDFNDEVGSDLESEDYDSVGGYLIGLLDHIPEKGEAAMDHAGNKIRCIAVDNNRIEKVRITLAPRDEKKEKNASAKEAGDEKGSKESGEKRREKNEENGQALRKDSENNPDVML